MDDTEIQVAIIEKRPSENIRDYVERRSFLSKTNGIVISTLDLTAGKILTEVRAWKELGELLLKKTSLNFRRKDFSGTFLLDIGTTSDIVVQELQKIFGGEIKIKKR